MPNFHPERAIQALVAERDRQAAAINDFAREYRRIMATTDAQVQAAIDKMAGGWHA